MRYASGEPGPRHWLRRWLRGRAQDALPEPLLRALVRLRHHELSWQSDRSTDAPPGYERTADRSGALALAVDRFDAQDWQDETTRAVAQTLDRAGISWLAVPTLYATPPRIAIDAGDASAAFAALRAAARPEWSVSRREPRDGSGLVFRVHERPAPLHSPDTIEVNRPAAAHRRRLGTATVLVEAWLTLPAGLTRRDGGHHSAGTKAAPEPNEVVAYLQPDLWEAGVGSPSHWPDDTDRRSVFELAEPIDVVYTWVDGLDPRWLARKARYAAAAGLADYHDTASMAARFADHDELRYSLRSIAMFANWVRQIYIVTDGQVPPWLDQDNKRITVIDHREIFADPSVLPVFNSHAIESQLHHIDGLSEHFLYLNDDIMLGRPISPATFFHGNGIAKFFLSPTTIDLSPPSVDDLPVVSAAKMNRALLAERFGVRVTQKFKHTPHALRRSVLDQMEAENPAEFARVAASRFRHPNDLSIASSLHHYYAYCLGEALPADISYSFLSIERSSTARQLDGLLRTRPEVFCVNDGSGDRAQHDVQRAMLAEFFERYFPLASEFERSDRTSTRS